MAMRLLLSPVLALALTGCGYFDNWFGEAEEPPLPGARLSVLELAESLEPDPQVADLAVTLPAAATMDGWPQAGGTPAHNPRHLALSSQLTEAWRANIGSGSGSNARLINPPVVAGGRVYAKDSEGRLTALDASSGERIWRVLAASPDEDSTPLGGGIAYADGRLFLTTGFGEVLSIDPANGGMIWRAAANGPTRAPPTVADGRVFVVTVDNQLEALDAETGETLWLHTGILEPAGLLGGASPAVAGDIVVAAYSSGELYALRVENGRPTWSDSLVAVRRVGTLSSLADIRGMPVIDEDLVFATSHSGRTAAIDLRSGVRVWEQDFGGIQTPWVAGDFIFLLTNESELVALTRRGGRIRWVTALPRWDDPEDRTGPIVWSGPVLAGGAVIAVSSEGDAVLLSPEDGQPIGEFELPGGTEIRPVVADGTLYVLTQDAELVAYR